MKLCGLDSFRPVTGSCEHGDEPPCSKCLDQLNYHHRIKELFNTTMACICLIRTAVTITREEQTAKGCDIGTEVQTRAEGSDVTPRGDREALGKSPPPLRVLV
jgi:hypothetical protein